MADNISKIRNEILTEDEKMEIIADYLENGGGGGGSSKLRIRIKTDYVPTSASELQSPDPNNPAIAFYNVTEGVTIQDENGDAVSATDFRTAVEAGNIEIIGVDNFPSAAVVDGASLTVVPLGITATSMPTSTLYSNAAHVAVGTLNIEGIYMFAGVSIAAGSDAVKASISVAVQQ